MFELNLAQNDKKLCILVVVLTSNLVLFELSVPGSALGGLCYDKHLMFLIKTFKKMLIQPDPDNNTRF